MPAYSFEALTAEGASRKGIIEADTARLARGMLRAQIHHKAPEAELREAALQGGMTLMRDDGERLVLSGITSREELVRVTRD